MNVNVYKCKECGEVFDVDPKCANCQVCPDCGSMNIQFVRTEKKTNG
jgi:predicted  nucleic acid-binding Zn-ribbon protein